MTFFSRFKDFHQCCCSMCSLTCLLSVQAQTEGALNGNPRYFVCIKLGNKTKKHIKIEIKEQFQKEISFTCFTRGKNCSYTYFKSFINAVVHAISMTLYGNTTFFNFFSTIQIFNQCSNTLFRQ